MVYYTISSERLYNFSKESVLNGTVATLTFFTKRESKLKFTKVTLTRTKQYLTVFLLNQGHKFNSFENHI